ERLYLLREEGACAALLVGCEPDNPVHWLDRSSVHGKEPVACPRGDERFRGRAVFGRSRIAVGADRREETGVDAPDADFDLRGGYAHRRGPAVGKLGVVGASRRGRLSGTPARPGGGRRLPARGSAAAGRGTAGSGVAGRCAVGGGAAGPCN